MELSKRGQGLSTNAIILIILGVFILAILILGFTVGWNVLKEKIAPSNNVGIISTACGTACATHSQYDFCSVKRKVNDGINKKFESTCNTLATEKDYKKYGVATCPAITCILAKTTLKK